MNASAKISSVHVISVDHLAMTIQIVLMLGVIYSLSNVLLVQKIIMPAVQIHARKSLPGQRKNNPYGEKSGKRPK